MSHSKMPGNRQPISIGVCAMAKKVNSKPMRAILNRLRGFANIKIVIFDESTIIESAIENWPIVNALVSFYSHGFPLDKAIKYADLRKPYLINDLRSQYVLMDRQLVYKKLLEHDIPVVRHAVFKRDDPEAVMNEDEDKITVNGATFHKPFVEKPINAEDHNIYIYFPSDAGGGGSVRLFRKIADRSSTYHSDCSSIRQYGSYIYEEFVATDGADVKVYAIGKDYAHAEARKSPALDGRVERDANGKEMRYPIILSAKEKIIAKKVVEAFNQNVCGFDLLRANGNSYVCDVNGFSFVKTSEKYYDDCAYLLYVIVTSAIAPKLSLHINYPTLNEPPLIRTTFGTVMELRSVIAVIRHGDRTPKQKVKFEVFNSKFFSLFNENKHQPTEAKLKKPSAMQRLLDIVNELLENMEASPNDHCIKESKEKLKQVKQVLEMYGHFSGINRKAQMKFTPNDGQIPEITVSPDSRDGKLVLVMKWGGELTEEGTTQAEALGRAFRVVYPGGESYSQEDGLGLLRLHSTYRHDLKIYASDEGRVQMTAAAFAKGFLDLEGPLTPILVQMVKSANTNGLLDSDNDSRRHMSDIKEKIRKILHVDREWTKEDVDELVPDRTNSLMKAMYNIGNPASASRQMLKFMATISQQLKSLKSKEEFHSSKLYHGESWELAIQRWKKLIRDFGVGESKFDFSKVPDIYDNIKYDLLHNQHWLDIEAAHNLHFIAKNMADLVVPNEYGIGKHEKLEIAQKICTPLLSKILTDAKTTNDLQPLQSNDFIRLNTDYSQNVSSPNRFVRTRLYFTSESHLHSLLTILRRGGLLDPNNDQQSDWANQFCDSVPELNYLSQIVFMIYEDPQQPVDSEARFHVELHFSPGVANTIDADESQPTINGFRTKGGKAATAATSHSTSLTAGNKKLKAGEGSPTAVVPVVEISDTQQQQPEQTAAIRQKIGRFKLLVDMQKSESFDRALPQFSQGKTRVCNSSATSPESQRPRQSSWSEELHCRPALRQSSVDESKNFDLLNVPDCSGMNYGTYHGSVDFEKIFGNIDFKSLLPAKAGNSLLFSTNVLKGLGQSDPQLPDAAAAAAASKSGQREVGSNSQESLDNWLEFGDGEQGEEGDRISAEQTRLSTAPSVPGIYPLETLHNSLTLKRLSDFLLDCISHGYKSPGVKSN